MAIKVDILEGHTSVTRTVVGSNPLTIDSHLNPVYLTPLETISTVLTVLAGAQGPPGLQNVYVGPTPPEDPIENMIWINTNP